MIKNIGPDGDSAYFSANSCYLNFCPCNSDKYLRYSFTGSL